MLVQNQEELAEMCSSLARHSVIAIDVETTGLNRFADNLVGVALATKEDEWYVVAEDNNISGLFSCLPGKTLIGHNVVFDMHFLSRAGLDIRENTWWDTMLMACLWEDNLAGSGLLSLKVLANILLGYKMQTWEEGFNDKPLLQQVEYATKDARATYDIAAWLQPRIQTQGLWEYYIMRCVPLIPAVFRMERAGLKVDVELLNKLRREWEEEREESYQEIVALSGVERFNPASPAQLVAWFENRGVNLPKTKSGKNSSASEEALIPLADKPGAVGRMAREVLRFRKTNKMINTYIFSDSTGGGLSQLVDEHHRVHPHWNYVGTVTGRFSCANPNLQNIPAHGDEHVLRDVFVAEDGNVFIVADMSQAEVRMLAALSQDKRLISILDTHDVHSEVASQLFGNSFTTLPENSPERKDLRHKAKTIVFGIIYGRGAGSIAKEFDITVQEAQELIDMFFGRFTGVKTWRQSVIDSAMRTGEVSMCFGRRRRPIVLRRPPSPGTIEGLVYEACYNIEVMKTGAAAVGYDRGQRQAVNSVIQGSVAEVINQAIVGLDSLGYSVVAQIHDEIILEVRDEDDTINRAIYDATAALSPVINGVPFAVVVSVAKRWGEAK